MTEQSITKRHTDPLEKWDRIRKAIYSAAVNRHEVMLHLPTCHRTNCPGHHSDDVDLVFRMFTDAIAESVHTELLCEAITTPDLGPDATDCHTLQDRMAGIAGPWSECEHHPRNEWLDEASRTDTQLGYWDWVRAKHDLRYGLSRPKAVEPLAISRDTQAYAAWWANLPDDVREGLEDSVKDLSADDSALVADSLHWLMLAAFYGNESVQWLTVSGLAARGAVYPVGLDIDPAYGSDGVLAGVDVVLRLYVTVGGRNLYQTITVNVDRPQRALVPTALDDAEIAIGQIIDEAAELITVEMNDRDAFWRAAR